MLSPRRSAQLGMGAACLIMVSSVAVIVAGANDPHNIVPTHTALTLPSTNSNHATQANFTLAVGHSELLASARR